MNVFKPIKRKNLKGIPMVITRDMVLFPGLTVGVPAGRDFTIAAIEAVAGTLEPIFITCQKDASIDVPNQQEIYDIGVIARVIKFFPPDENGVRNALVCVLSVARLKTMEWDGAYPTCWAEQIKETFPEGDDAEMPVIIASITDVYKKILNYIDEEHLKEVTEQMEQIPHPVPLIHFMTLNSPLDSEEKQEILAATDLKKRAEEILKHLSSAMQMMEIRSDIARRTQERMSQQQREHFLRQQMASIEDELGGTIEDEEADELFARSEKMDWPEEAATHFSKEMRKLERFPASSPEYGIQYNYLETLLNLPWNKRTADNFDIAKVRESLDADHYGLEKVKERIIEQVAVFKLRGDMKAPILCLYGPPGVGKTSLGKSIAKAIGREYARVALGGVHDEAEIRGHRRTYVGSMPGRIISALEKCGSSNPVFVLDEIDKIAREAKGDPSSALLEVLDPEQNSHYHDNYLNYDYDLSGIMFIATANDLSTVSRPLLDRMELIEIPGYVTDEKIFIARRHLIPKVLEEHGLTKDAMSLDADTLTYIIDRYTHESGVRLLEKQLARLIRKLAVREAEGKALPENIDAATVRELLGPELEDPETYEGNKQAGVVTGLAWTAAGGEILFVEALLTPGKGKLTLTGQLGDVMKESATIALEYLRSHAEMLGLDHKVFDAYDVHIHVPQGAIPKDGPSAGVTMTTAIASAFTRRLIAPRLAMTGEITLRGRVLPVGGIKEKILAAKRAGISHIILCKQNRKDIEQINERYLKGLSFTYVDTISEVLACALTDETDPTLPPRIPAENKK